MWILIILFAIFLLLKYIKYKKESIKIELDSVTFFEGPLGSGKTRLLTYMAIKSFKKRVMIYKLFRFLEIITFHIFKSKKFIPHVYSNYPIYLGRKYGFSQVVNCQVLNWQYKIEEGSIVVLDEVGYIFPNQKEKTSDDYIFGITWLRHATDCVLLCASQSLSECNIAFRRKVNRCYHLHNCSKFFWRLSSVEVVPVIISEDIKNVYSSSSSDTVLQRFMFLNPKNNFNSRYGRDLYLLKESERNAIASNYNLLLQRLGYKNGDYWKSLSYDIK